MPQPRRPSSCPVKVRHLQVHCKTAVISILLPRLSPLSPRILLFSSSVARRRFVGELECGLSKILVSSLQQTTRHNLCSLLIWSPAFVVEAQKTRFLGFPAELARSLMEKLSYWICFNQTHNVAVSCHITYFCYLPPVLSAVLRACPAVTSIISSFGVFNCLGRAFSLVIGHQEARDRLSNIFHMRSWSPTSGLATTGPKDCMWSLCLARAAWPE